MQIWKIERGKWEKKRFRPFPDPRYGLMHILMTRVNHKIGHHYVVFSKKEQATLRNIAAQFMGKTDKALDDVFRSIVDGAFEKRWAGAAAIVTYVYPTLQPKPNAKMRLAVEFNKPGTKPIPIL
jgi:hypothetical protein